MLTERLLSDLSCFLINRVIVHSHMKGQVEATRILSKLCNWADENDATLMLDISSDDDIDYAQLHELEFAEIGDLPGIIRREPTGS